ncbi:MAG: 50S ribosomal protein L25 [Clostridiales bacterium]|nr:50S ribosomal protein L25 [Clostridiales bacterium]
MAETVKLNIDIRTDLSKAEKKRLRNNGYLIGNISRKGMESVAISVRKEEFRRALKKNGRNAVLTLVSDDKTSFNVMVKDVLVTPPAYDLMHVDFQQVSLTEAVKADVAIRYVGVEFLEAQRLIVNRIMDTISVMGLPHEIPDDIEIDVAKLNAGDTFTIGDVKLPEGITSDIEADQILFTINEAKVVEEEGEEEGEEEEEVTAEAEIV